MGVLGQRVQTLRTQLEMSQEDLADKSGLTQATISRIETGEIEELKSEALMRLATALKTTVDYLVGKVGKSVPDELQFADPAARHIFRGWEKLSPAARKKVMEYFKLLEESEKKRGKR